MWPFDKNNKKESNDEYPKTKTESRTATKTYKVYDVKANTVSGKELSFRHEGAYLVSDDNKIYADKVIPMKSDLRHRPLSGYSVDLKTKSSFATINIDNVETYDYSILERKTVIINYEAKLEKPLSPTRWREVDYVIKDIQVKEKAEPAE